MDAANEDAVAADSCCSFTIDVIDDDLGGNGGAVSAALDPAGRLAVAYGTDHPFLRVARETAAGWSLTDVDGRAVASTQIAFTPANEPRIAFIDAIAHTLSVASDDGAGFRITRIDDVPLATFDTPSLSSDGRFLSFTGYPTDQLRDAELRLATFDGQWSVRAFTGREGWLESSLSLDPGGAPWIAGFRSRGRPAVEAFAPPDQVTRTVVDPDGGKPALKIDLQGNLHLAYSGADGTEIRYATQQPGGMWRTETIAQSERRSYDVWLALGPDDTVYVPFYDNGQNDLRLAVRENGAWSVHTVDGPRSVGQYTGAVVDGGGKLHLFYFDQTNGALKHAR